VGAVYNTHHGTTNAVVMRAVLQFNRPAVEDRLTQAAAYLGIAGGFDGFSARVDELNATLGVPKGLAAMGVKDASVDDLVEMALQDPSVGGNPVAMTAKNTRALFLAAM
jgi:alcohol dehydrogenase class IV